MGNSQTKTIDLRFHKLKIDQGNKEYVDFRKIISKYPFMDFNYFKENRNIVILTTPHSKCYNEKYRTCDLNAKPFLESVIETLKGHFEVKVFESENFRDQADLNRIWDRDKGFRPQLRNFIKENKEKILFLLDLHSFPEYYKGFGDCDVALLDDTAYLSLFKETFDPEIQIAFPKYIYCLKELLEEKFKTSLVAGSINDIQNEARIDFGIPAILIECKENLTKDQLNLIAVQIALFLEKIAIPVINLEPK